MIDRISKRIWILYKSMLHQRKKMPCSKKKAEMLARLNPGKDKNELIDAYYIKNISRLVKFSLAGLVLVIALLINNHSNHLIDENNHIKRNDYGKSAYDASVIAEIEGESYDIDFVVTEREYTDQEIEELLIECIKQTEEILKDSNTELSHVENDLNPVNQIKGFPFYIYWETSDYEIIHEDGVLSENQKSETGNNCELKAYFTYKKFKSEHIYNITVFPVQSTKEEQIKNEIIASIQQMQSQTKYDSFLLLPASIGDKSISWKESENYVPAMMATLLFLSGIGIWIGINNDLAKEYRKRNQLLTLEYSEFVSKLQLLIGSGMTLRTAFERIGADYIYSLKNNGEKKYVYEEVIILLKHIHDGLGEEESLNMFGKSCDHISYKKLVTLLIQNSRKGTAGLMSALSNEMKVAFEERKQIAKRMGEEAQTKLLFPMILMLVVVMIIIIIPAYATF